MLNKKNRKRFHMYSANAISFATVDLARYSEIPDSIHSDHVAVLKDLMYENKYLAQTSQPEEKLFISKKIDLITKEAGYIASKLKAFTKVNFINLEIDGLNDSLNLITLPISMVL